MKAEDIMTSDVITVGLQDTIEDVAKILVEKKISGLPVVDEGELVGIISEGDIVFQNKKVTPPAYVDILGALITIGSQEQYLHEIKRALATQVKDLMVTNVMTVEAEASLEEVATMMIDHNINRVPVVSKKKLLGIITRQDILKAMGNR
ncbi:hypothetical protein BHU72_04260 [Desulfuribacillus stibiiarsenatis]|uniref:CBS domain-containing protein n=1 Tax=Desulfuribacillus stibiiarsenatis TaxID=1390249 RepID=A0A1E5L5A3_9FIRM|nr:CBS domain-containing protein [Desulfuribacillus stibiiarsenatis]OEH85315.1 hypothetical protein BHU72_04260 [Desulfuribacillus stibiiarsenatis]